MQERQRIHDQIKQDQLAKEESVRKQKEAEEKRIKDAHAKKLREEAERKNKEEQQKKQAEDQKKQAEEQKQELERKEQEAKTEKEQISKMASEVSRKRWIRELIEKIADRNYGSKEAIQFAEECIQKVKHVKETVDIQVKSNKAMMNEALRYRMQFTTKVGAVTNSRRHIQQFVGPCTSRDSI